MKVVEINNQRTYEITEGEYTIYLHVINGNYVITNEKDSQEFVFNYENSEETRRKWSTIASMIKRATKLMEGL